MRRTLCVTKTTMKEKALQQYKHFFFDMDGTLTKSRTEIDGNVALALATLIGRGKTVAVISGATNAQIYKQIPFLGNSVRAFVMGQSGNDVRFGWEHYWTNKLEEAEVQKITNHIEQLLQFRGTTDTTDLVEYRGAQVSFSMVGHNADLEVKKKFDPDGTKRRAVLDAIPFEEDGMMVKIGGTTCLDYTRKGWGKRGNIKRLIEHLHIEAEDCLYIGDQLYSGGNDEDMIGFIDTRAVTSPEDTLELINQITNDKST